MNPTSSRDRKKILVIDDESSIITYLTTVLEDSGYETCSAADAEAGLSLARQERPDLITLDIMMPRRSGVALYQQLKIDPELRDIPVVFVSAFSRSSGFGPASFREMVPDQKIPIPEIYLEKPVAVPEFLRAVASLIESAEAASGSREGGAS
jgi:CheY-like chemotaxis protein